jgi:hypothetical protein
MTAAPMMAFAAPVWSLPISLRTFAVIAMLVAVSAVPTKIAPGAEIPNRRQSPYPPAQGMITPTRAMKR